MPRRDIDFLFEVGSLRKMPRAWQQLLSSRVANIPEHTFRMALIAWIIAEAEEADVNKVIRMSLVHDIGESRATDIAFMHRDYVKRDEKLAEGDVLKDVTIEKEALALLSEYDERKTLEARIVKDADNLDIDLELKEMTENGDKAALGMQRDHRPHVREVKLYTNTAKEMWDAIQQGDPNNWHQPLTNKWVKNKSGAK